MSTPYVPSLEQVRENAAVIIARADDHEYWLIGHDVYRVKHPEIVDIYGVPSDRRWECSIEHWRRYRPIFNWAKDI